MGVQHARKLNLMPLITQEFPFAQGEGAYPLLDEQPEEAVQVVLSFGGTRPAAAAVSQEKQLAPAGAPA
jgi:hypothetical protein